MKTNCLRVFLLLMLAAGMMAGCSKKGGTSESARILEQGEISSYYLKEEHGFLMSDVTMTLPDYSSLFAKYAQQAVESTETEEDFEKLLYQLVLEEIEESPTYILQTVSINLSEIDSEKTKEQWTEEEILQYAREAAFRKEIEELYFDMFDVQSYLNLESGGEN